MKRLRNSLTDKRHSVGRNRTTLRRKRFRSSGSTGEGAVCDERNIDIFAEQGASPDVHVAGDGSFGAGRLCGFGAGLAPSYQIAA